MKTYYFKTNQRNFKVYAAEESIAAMIANNNLNEGEEILKSDDQVWGYGNYNAPYGCLRRDDFDDTPTFYSVDECEAAEMLLSSINHRVMLEGQLREAKFNERDYRDILRHMIESKYEAWNQIPEWIEFHGRLIHYIHNDDGNSGIEIIQPVKI